MRFPIIRRRYDLLPVEFDFEEILDNFLKYPLKAGFDRGKALAIDVYEKNGKAIVNIELPGADPKDIKLSVDGNILTVSGEKKDERETRKENYYRIESSYGKFERSVELPFDVKPEDAKAVYKKGILEVELPKAGAQRKKDIKIDIT